MDSSIRQLLAAANIVPAEDARNHLQQAYKLLESASKIATRSDDSNPCGADLFVIAAETAFMLNERKMAEGALQMYFQGQQLTDQFLCRAYLCKAQVLSSKSPNSSSDLDSAVVFLLKAINFAKDKPRYHFIVYNASVLFWQMARQFMRPGHRGLLHQSLQQIVKALDDINEQDHEWRATLMVALVESLIDAGKTKEAVAASESAADFTLKYAKCKFKDIFRLQIQHKLVEQSKLGKGVNNIPEFLAFLKLQKIKRSFAQGKYTESKADLKKELQSLVKLVSKTDPKATPGGRKSSQTGSVDSVSRVSSVSPQRRQSRTMSKPTIDIPFGFMSEMGKDLLPGLLMEVALFCTDHEEVKLARDCIKSLEMLEDKDPSMDLQIECLKCQMLVKDLGDNQEVYIKSSVDVRLFAVKRMDQNIQNAVRSGNAHVVQAACVTQWNICFPLLQPNLRKHVRKPLTLVAQSLEDISSLEIQLRCQIHTELAKCEEDVEQVEAALRHIRKALQHDQTGLYHQRLQTMLRRLELSTQLYQTPETPEDTAAVIIEQARKSADSGSVRMKRSLLVKAGIALAPDAFQYVLDSEGEVKVSGQKSEVNLLGAKALQWQKCVKKAAGHLKRLGDENDRERARLWADLAKVGRKQEVWDVCRVAARFCLLYDDGRWGVVKSYADPQDSGMPVNTEVPRSQEAPTEFSQNQGLVSMTDASDSTSLHDTDLLRMLAEVQFINGEALIHLLQCQSLKLNQTPRYPTDARQRPKSSTGFKTAEIDTEWITYTEWIRMLSDATTRSFLRSIELGVDLKESWIVCSGTAYLWNYNKHLIADGQLTQLVDIFEAALNGLRKVGHSSEIVLLVRVCNLIAQGLLRPWLVSKSPGDVTADPTPDAGSSKPPSRKKTASRDKAPTGMSGNASIVVDGDATDDLKKALEVCEYAIEVTQGNVKKDIVPAAVRHEFIATWVQLKQMLQQQIGPGLGVENEIIPSQRDMTKALIMLEIHTLNSNGMMELTVPPLSETADMTESCEWSDKSVELEVWTRLASLAHSIKEHSLVVKCAEKALAFEGIVLKSSKKGKARTHKVVVDFEMLSYAACILGESIMTTVTSNPYARRQAMESFVKSAYFGELAGNYVLVMSACRWWWNACLPLMSSSIERELLRKPLNSLLRFITITSARLKVSIEQQEKEQALSKAIIPNAGTEEVTSNQDSDNSLRAAMYGILFQTYTDKGNWEDALNCMDQAVQHMPRTKHRLPIFKNRIMVKAKLGRSVYADIAKFREESEQYVAHMWHRVALSSHEQLQQLASYQKAIESLHSEENLWIKFEYLAELSAWLYCNEFPIADAVNILEWAADILFSMKFEVIKKEEKASPSKGKGRKAPGKPAKTPASREATKTRDSTRSVKIDVKSKPGTSDEAAKRKTGDEKKDGEDGVDEYIPVEKEVVIGLESANLDLKLEDLNSVRQLEGLVRTHVMLATITGRGSEQHKTYCQLAVGYIIQIWKISLQAAGPLINQLPKIEGGVDKNPGKGAPQAAKTQKKGPPDSMPDDVTEWATYSPPEDIRRAFLFNDGDTAISTKTITKPALTMHYLDELLKEVCFLGYHHLALPVISLAEVIASGVLNCQSWGALMNIQKIKICYDLGLTSAAQHWEATLGDEFLPEEEQSNFLQEHELMLQHEKQVQHEEAKIKASSPEKKERENTETPEPITMQGKIIKGISMRRLWMEKALALLDLAYHQRARELFNQSMAAAVAYKDKKLEGDVYLGLSQLSIQESNLGQALRFLNKAQDIGGDEKYWYRIIVMLIDAIVLDPDVTPPNIKHTHELIKSASETMNILRAARPTKASTIAYITSVINSYSALMKLKNVISEKGKLGRMVHTYLSKLEEAENNLFVHGYIRETVRLYREHGKILAKLYDRTNVIEEQHSFLLTGLERLQHGMQILTDMYMKVSSTVNTKKSSDISLPLLGELVDTQIVLSQHYLLMYEIDANEHISSRKLQAKSGSLEHIVKEYVGNERDLSHLDREWKNVCELVPQMILSTLTSCYSFTVTMPSKRAKCLFLIGKTLRLLSMYSGGDIDVRWNVFAYDLTETNDEELELRDSDLLPQESSSELIDRTVSSKSKSSNDSTLTIKQRKKLSENGLKIIKQEEASKKLITQATEVLLQSIKMSLELQLLDIVQDASLEMVEACSQLDNNTSSLFLALYQSSKVSRSLRDLLVRAQPDPTLSQFSALLHQEMWLTKNRPHMTVSSVYAWIQKSLEKFTAWKRLAVSPNHVDILKDFPPNFNFVVLQHSPDHRYLYVSLLDKPKSASSTSDGKGKSKDKQAQSGSESRAFVLRANVDPAMLEDLKERMEEYGMHLMSLLLQSEYQRAQAAQREKMLQQLSLGNDNPDMALSKTALEEQEEEEMRLIDEFQDIVDLLEMYLSPVTSMLKECLIDPLKKECEEQIQTGQAPDINAMESVVLLVDEVLMSLPLEALQCFQTPFIDCFCRDMSLQMSHHRWNVDPEEVAAAAEKKTEAAKANPKTPKTGKDNRKTPGGGVGKVVPLNREVLPGCGTINTNNVHYVVDPLDEAAETEEYKPMQTFNQLLQTYSTSCTSNWTGLLGSSGVPSAGQWEKSVNGCDAFIFHGMERFFAHMAPAKVCALDLTGCQLTILLDKAQTSKSFRHQSKVDVDKSDSLLVLEKPLPTVQLLSLVGVNAICINLWHSTLEDNTSKLQRIANTLFDNGQVVGKAIRSSLNPSLKKPTPPEPPPTAPSGKDKSDGKGGKAGKGKDSRKISPSPRPTPTPIQTPEIVDSPSLAEEPMELPPEDNTVQASWSNFVLFGLPNIMVV